MKVNFTDRGPCQMKPGDIRRIPSDRSKKLVSYQICCPECGFVVTVFEDSGMQIAETGKHVSFSKSKICPYCRSSLLLVGSILILKHDG